MKNPSNRLTRFYPLTLTVALVLTLLSLAAFFATRVFFVPRATYFIIGMILMGLAGLITWILFRLFHVVSYTPEPVLQILSYSSLYDEMKWSILNAKFTVYSVSPLSSHLFQRLFRSASLKPNIARKLNFYWRHIWVPSKDYEEAVKSLRVLGEISNRVYGNTVDPKDAFVYCIIDGTKVYLLFEGEISERTWGLKLNLDDFASALTREFENMWVLSKEFTRDRHASDECHS